MANGRSPLGEPRRDEIPRGGVEENRYAFDIARSFERHVSEICIHDGASQPYEASRSRRNLLRFVDELGEDYYTGGYPPDILRLFALLLTEGISIAAQWDVVEGRKACPHGIASYPWLQRFDAEAGVSASLDAAAGGARTGPPWDASPKRRPVQRNRVGDGEPDSVATR